MKRMGLLTLCLTVLLGMAGCNQQISAPAGEKTAVLFSSLAQMWIEAGGTVDITVGESVERGFAAADTPLVDEGAGKSINVELLLSYRPTLVIYSTDIPAQTEAAELLEQSGIATRGYRVESYEDYRQVLTDMAKLTDADVKAHLDQIEGLRRSALESRQGAKAETILFIRAGSSASSTKAKRGEDHFACAMLEEMGCINLADRAPVLLDGLSMEEILKEQPRHVFISLMGEEKAARQWVEQMLQNDAWQGVQAVQEGRVHILPKELFHFKPNARWGESYQYLADLLNEEK